MLQASGTRRVIPLSIRFPLQAREAAVTAGRRASGASGGVLAGGKPQPGIVCRYSVNKWG